MSNQTLGSHFGKQPIFNSRYTDLFNQILAIASNRMDAAMGEELKQHIMQWLEKNPLHHDFNSYSSDKYVRTYIGRDEHTRWEAIVVSWQQGNATTVHSHPQFAGYNFADGVFKIEVFEPHDQQTAKLIKTIIVDKPYGMFAIGDANTFTNHIHRITCISPTAHSLHVYSDDALNGLVYKEV